MTQESDERQPPSWQPWRPPAPPPWWKRLWKWTDLGNKSGWNWLELLSALAIPFVILAVGLRFAAQQDEQQRDFEATRDQRAQTIEDRRAESERDNEEQRAQDAALQAYFDQMSQLLLQEDLRSSEEDSEVRTLARARTLTVLERLDPSRKTEVMRFLSEAELVQSANERDAIIIELRGADLSDTDLSDTDLSGADLSGADLSGADLPGGVSLADLYRAGLPSGLFADLTDADLHRAGLPLADLSGADLSFADLSGADLSGAILTTCHESLSYLPCTDLSGADLTYADLTDAEGITKEQLERQAESLEGATMPDRSKHP